MFKRKKRVTNWDVSDEIAKQGKYIKKYSVFNIHSLERQENNFNIDIKRFSEERQQCRTAYESYSSKKDATDPNLKKLLDKLLDLADIEYRQRVKRLNDYRESMEDIKQIFSGLTGNDGSRRKLNDDEVQQYAKKARDIIRRLSSPLEELDTVILQLDNGVDIIDVIGVWDICRKFIMRDPSVREKDHTTYEFYPDLSKKVDAIKYVTDACKKGYRPTTKAYLRCISVVEDIIPSLHGFGWTTQGSIHVKCYLSHDDSPTKEFICGLSKDYRSHVKLHEIPKRQEWGDHLKVAIGSKSYPRDTDAELAVASAALSILYKLDPIGLKKMNPIERLSAWYRYLND